jgi:hypothetical protein
MIATGEAMDVRDWGPACLSGRREPEHDPLAEEFAGPWCDPGDSEPIPGRCGVAPLRPEEEARLRAAYGSREPFWDKDWDTLALLSAIDAARRERDALRAAVRVCERAMLGDEGPDLSAAWAALHALLPPEAAP